MNPASKGVTKSKRNCCVVGCSNTEANSAREVRFYLFPNRPWEQDKRQKWINAVNRNNPDGSKWSPSPISCICSTHFVGNNKSGHPLNPSFIPTIFPEVYKVKPLTEAHASRFQRAQKRTSCVCNGLKENCNKRSNLGLENEQLLSDSGPIEIPNEIPMCAQESTVEEHVPKFKDASTQTDICVMPQNSIKCFTTVSRETQTKIEPPKRTMADKETNIVSVTRSTNFLHCEGFHGYSSIENDTEMQDIAGVTLAIFGLLLSLLPNSTERKISKENKLLIFLMKMKTGFTYSALRVLFGVHRTTVALIFKTILMHLTQATHNFVFWPSQPSVYSTMPKEFKESYPKCRVIIDCSEIRVEQPKEIGNRIHFYSHYKSAFTLKFLIGITPSGMVSFVSKCYGGRSSDSSITVDCKLLDLLEPGDEVMADKGFPGIKTMLDDRHVVIVMPPFLHNGRFTEEEVNETYKVASIRIHVERMIQRVKVYNILQKVPVEMIPHIDDTVRMCCVLANLQMPIIKPDD